METRLGDNSLVHVAGLTCFPVRERLDATVKPSYSSCVRLVERAGTRRRVV